MSIATPRTASRWLGELPQRFLEGRLSHVATAWTSNVDKHTVAGEPPVRLCNYTDVYKNDTITSDISFMAATASREQIERFRIQDGDTIITKDSETADDIGIPAFVEYEADDLICGYHLAIVRPDPERVAPRYLYWVMGSELVLGQWSVQASGVTRVGIRSTDLTKVAIPLTSLDEQRAIADFLDEQTSRIDTLIDKQTQLIATLRERRVLAREGLAGHVAVGERLKWSVGEIDDRAGDSASELPLMSVSIDWGLRRRDSMTSDPPRAEDLANYKVCQSGDIVVNRMRAFQGALGVASEEGIVSPDYAVLRCADGPVPEWLAEVMRTKQFVGEMVTRIRGIGGTDSGSVRTPRINVTDLLEIRVSYPSRDTQVEDIRGMRKQTAKIDTLIAKTEQHIALAKERRSALITAAVTGQIDVRTPARTEKVDA